MSNDNEIYQKACLALCQINSRNPVFDFKGYDLSIDQIKKIAETVNSALSTVGIPSVCASVNSTAIMLQGEISEEFPMKEVLQAIHGIRDAANGSHISPFSQQSLSKLSCFTNSLKGGAAISVEGKAVITYSATTDLSKKDHASRAA